MLGELECYSKQLEKIFKFLGIRDISKVQFKNLKDGSLVDYEIYFSAEFYYDDEFLFKLELKDYSDNSIAFSLDNPKYKEEYEIDITNDDCIKLFSLKQEFKNGLVFKRCYRKYGADFEIIYNDYHLKYSTSDGIDSDTQRVANEEILVSYLIEIIMGGFNVSIDELYKRICEITEITSREKRFELSVKKGDDCIGKIKGKGPSIESFLSKKNQNNLFVNFVSYWGYLLKKEVVYDDGGKEHLIGTLVVEEKDKKVRETLEWSEAIDPQIVYLYQKQQMFDDLLQMRQDIQEIININYTLGNEKVQGVKHSC